MKKNMEKYLFSAACSTDSGWISSDNTCGSI